jgi:molecular chaperone GrpE
MKGKQQGVEEKPEHENAKPESKSEGRLGTQPELKPEGKSIPETVPKSELEACQRSRKELEDIAKRLQAEFENYQKRVAKETEHNIRFSCVGFLHKLLPLLDSFDQALRNPGPEKDGIGLLHRQLLAILSTEGVRPIETIGQRFDPYRHEVLLQESLEGKEDETVLEEIQKGYMVHDKVLRYAKVKINKVKT